jgi:hypothetical protein
MCPSSDDHENGGNKEQCSQLMEQIRHIPGAVDFRIQEPNDAPQLNVTIDRTMSSVLGVTAHAVSNSVLGALAGSNQTSPNFWVDPSATDFDPLLRSAIIQDKEHKSQVCFTSCPTAPKLLGHCRKQVRFLVAGT